MNITPITKLYVSPKNVRTVCSDTTKAVSPKQKEVFCYTKSIVKNTPNEFSNSRGNYLADIDLTDFYVKRAAVSKVSFLADMELTDAYDPPEKRNSNIQFTGRGAKYLYIVQHAAIDLYKNTKRNFT